MSDIITEPLDLRRAFKNTLDNDVSQFNDYLTLGKLFEAMGEKKAASECYFAFVKNALEYQKKQDGVDRTEVVSFYGMSVGSSALSSFSGAVEFVLSALYLTYLHTSFVTEIVRNKIRYEKRPPKKLNTQAPSVVSLFLKWVKDAYGSRSLQSIAVLERYVRELIEYNGDIFVSNIPTENIFLKWRTAFTDTLPRDKDAEFLLAL